MAMIDYGTVVFKNGIRYKENDLFPNIDELDIYFYKNSMSSMYSSINKYFGYDNKKSYRFTYQDRNFWVKEICPRVYKCEITGGNDKYFIIFGYGIDSKKDIWDRVKKVYLGKNYKKVDRILNRFNDWRGAK